jgi:hypothetical protein
VPVEASVAALSHAHNHDPAAHLKQEVHRVGERLAHAILESQYRGRFDLERFTRQLQRAFGGGRTLRRGGHRRGLNLT